MNEKIIAYLRGPRPYREGVALYEQYGINLMLKATFRRNVESELLHATLMEELRRLAGISETEFRTMKRMAVVADMPSDEINTVKAVASMENAPVTPVVENMIRFRDRFPILNSPDCPDVLKIVVADMFTAYDLYLSSYKELVNLPDDAELEQSFSIAKTAVENYLKDRAIWEELEYYQDNKKLLGKHPRVAQFVESEGLADKTDLEVDKIGKNAASNVSKWKKKADAATDEKERAKALEALNKWEATKNAAVAELEARKKK